MIAEAHHEERFKNLHEQVKAETVFKKDEEVERVCTECGYVHK
jgi:rubrerythrin